MFCFNGVLDSRGLPFRDKTVLLWSLTREDTQYGYPKRSLKGHSHFVQDVVISSDGQFALTGSWDHTLRLWDLHTGQTTRRFIGHTKDVLSVAFSMDNRQVHLRTYLQQSWSRLLLMLSLCLGPLYGPPGLHCMRKVISNNRGCLPKCLRWLLGATERACRLEDARIAPGR